MTADLVHEKLRSLGLQLPTVSTPGGNYLSVTIRGSIAYVAIQFPIWNGEYLYLSRLGRDISTQEGIQAMELCALHVLAQINDKIGFENVLGLNHLEAYFQSVEGWDDSPLVVDGASDLFVKVLGDSGLHSRSIVGAERLPRNFCVGLTASLTLKG
ncbi:RidA family protein [Ulvibacterium marinum]|uniref:RidA family protein n=1 Tax=Ulvibacterium marinum TaxID=2419782 RepID=UPI0024942137|nr:RidA family protein [Ulvibacterium marinum]